MNEDRRMEPVRRLLGLMAEHVERWLEGDELALEALGEAIHESGATEDQLQAAVLTLRGIAGAPVAGGIAAVDEPPGRRAQRVLNAQERESLTPEAWGYLLGLRSRGSLDANQFERVLERLTALDVRPIGVELAREMAARIALRAANPAGSFESGAVDGEIAH